MVACHKILLYSDLDALVEGAEDGAGFGLLR